MGDLNKKKKFNIKKISRYKNIPIIISLSLSLFFESITLGIVINHLSQKKRNHLETLKRIELSINSTNEDVYNSINNALRINSYLNDKERNIISSYSWVFLNNKNNIDLEYFIKCLSTLKIVYDINEKCENGTVSVNGSYNTEKNTITFYHSNNIDDVELSTFTHEMFHVMQKICKTDYNSFLIETVNTIFNEEYTGTHENSSYTSYYNFTKMLIEIIGKEPFRKYECYTDITPIINELVNIDGSEREAYNLLCNLDCYKNLIEQIKYDGSYFDNIKITNLEKLNKDIINQISNYYEKKYNRIIENDLIMLYYYDYSKFCSKLCERLNDSNSNVTLVNNNIDYFIDNYCTNLIVSIESYAKVKCINIDKDGVSNIKDEDSLKYTYSYIIDESNRYLNENELIKKISN